MEEKTINELQAQMSSGETSSAAITQAYLDRIEALDRNGPLLNAVIETNPDAMAVAQARDNERQAGKLRGPLHGIPILIKDNFDTGDRMQTTPGSLALVGAPARRDAYLVRRLRAAGAVLLGKTNLSEWANFGSTRSTSGWSSRGGQTRNPYALDRNPCGAHLIEVVAKQVDVSPLQSGELVTTGTLTAALPIHAGQNWTRNINGLSLPGISVSFEV